MTEKIGNPRGRIAVYLDEGEAIDLAEHFGPGDGFYSELMDAVERAYPETAPARARPSLPARQDLTPEPATRPAGASSPEREAQAP